MVGWWAEAPAEERGNERFGFGASLGRQGDLVAGKGESAGCQHRQDAVFRRVRECHFERRAVQTGSTADVLPGRAVAERVLAEERLCCVGHTAGSCAEPRG